MRDLCAGALIRTCRLERNFSQEGLCRGICAASYLSKIEKGTVTPSEEIVQKLFAALDLTYTTDEAVLAPLRKATDNARALESFGRAHALAPSAVTTYHQCNMHFREGRYQEALRFARQAYDRAAR